MNFVTDINLWNWSFDFSENKKWSDDVDCGVAYVYHGSPFYDVTWFVILIFTPFKDLKYYSSFTCGRSRFTLWLRISVAFLSFCRQVSEYYLRVYLDSFLLTFFPIQFSLIIITFDSIYSELLKSLQMNHKQIHYHCRENMNSHCPALWKSPLQTPV